MSHLIDELTPLIAGGSTYKIVLFGTLPITQTPEMGCFSLPENEVSEFVVLDAPLFPSLQVPVECALQSLDVVLRRAHLQSRSLLMTSALSLGIAVFVAWSWYQHQRSMVVPRLAAVAAVNLYSPYQAALSSGAPDQQLAQLAHFYGELYAVPGWGIEHLHYDGKILNVQFASHGGSLNDLMQWASQQHFSMEPNLERPSLQMAFTVPNRDQPKVIYSTSQITSLLLDHLDQVLPQKNIQFGNIQTHGPTQQRSIVVSLDSISPEVLDLIGQQLRNLPLQLTEVDFHVAQSLISGTIKLEIWGT